MRRAWFGIGATAGLLALGGGAAFAQGGRELQVGSRWAVIVGVDAYQSPNVQRLSGAVGDARAVRDSLVKFAEFPDSQVILLTSDGPTKPTAAGILDVLGKVRQSSKPDDLVLFFFAGHGVEVDGQRYLLAYDANIGTPGQLKQSSLAAGTLMTELMAIPAKHRVIMIDACRNNPMKGSTEANVATDTFETAFTLPPAREGGVHATFLSCSKGQSAYEWSERKRGFFSWFIERGLAGEAATQGPVTLSSLNSYLEESVPQAVRQYRNRPQIPYAKVEGPRFVLVRGERVARNAVTLDQRPVAPTRTVWGVVKDSKGLPLKGAKVTVTRVARAGGDRGLEHVDISAETARPAHQVEVVTIETDEDGHFKVDVKPADADLEVSANVGSYVVRKVSSPASENGKKISLFLPAETPQPGPSPRVITPTPSPRDPAEAARAAEAAKRAAEAERVAALARQGQEMAQAAYRTFLEEDFREAEKLARDALGVDKDNALANAVLGNSMLAGIQGAQKDKLARARDHIDRALKREPGLALAHNALGMALYVSGDVSGARAEFQRAVQLDPRLAVAHGNLGQVHSDQKRLPDAKKAFEQAADLRPDSAIPYNGLSTVLHTLGKFGDAEKAARAAIARYQLRDLHLAKFYVQLAVTLHAQGKSSKQEQALEAVARAKGLGLESDPAYDVITKTRG
jgi:Flp pilus assembly protein TadD